MHVYIYIYICIYNIYIYIYNWGGVSELTPESTRVTDALLAVEHGKLVREGQRRVAHLPLASSGQPIKIPGERGDNKCRVNHGSFVIKFLVACVCRSRANFGLSALHMYVKIREIWHGMP